MAKESSFDVVSSEIKPLLDASLFSVERPKLKVPAVSNYS